VQTIEFSLAYHHEEIESPLLGTPLVGKIMETDRLRGYLLPVPACNDEDAFFIGQDEDSTCLDTSVWDAGVDESSGVSA
jgi:hypothetical protein